MRIDNTLPEARIDLDARHQPFPLLPIQQSYLFARNSSGYLAGIATGPYYEVEFDHLDVARVEKAWNRLIERHEMLRVAFTPDGEQYLREQLDYKIRYYDLTGRDATEAEQALQRIRDEMLHTSLPQSGPLFDLRVSRSAERKFRMHFTLDMLGSDLGSLVIMILEFGRLYADPDATLTPKQLSFRDYALAFQEMSASAAYLADRQYWMDRLADFPNGPDLPRLQEPAAGTQRFTRHAFTLTPDEWTLVKRRSRKLGVPPTVLLLTVFAEILSRWSRTKRFAVNVTMMNRLAVHEEVEQLVGEFTSNILLEIDASREASLAERARAIKTQLRDDVRHGLFSGVEFIRELLRARSGGSAVRMDVVFTSYLRFAEPYRKNYTWRNDKDLSTAKLGYNHTRTSQVAIDHQACEMLDGSALIWWDSVDELFPPRLMDDMLESYESMLRRLCTEQTASAGMLDELPLRQRKIREQVNADRQPISADLLHTLFQQQAVKTPANPAIRTDEMEISYAQLDRWSNALALQLIDAGAAPNTLIGVLMRKGWQQVVAVLGILKAGAAYMPLDADLPPLRITGLLEQGECRLLVKTPDLGASCAPESVQKVFDVSVETLRDLPSGSPVCRQSIEDIAYVIFTSGSTGTPKGVVIDHRGAVNTVLDINRRFGVGEQDRVLALSSLGFDLSVYDIFGLLAVGGCIVYPHHSEMKSHDKWWSLIQRHGVTVWNTVPALMQLLVDDCELHKSRHLHGLKLVMMSGDWIPVSLPGRIFDLVKPECQVISLGGATEASIWSIYYPIRERTDSLRSVPYGKPLANQSFHVLDEHRRPCPDWVSGDLYIGGIGVAKGYWKDAEKTRNSFVTIDGEVLYRTGDRGRYIEDGNIEFLGREDKQVKINGHRIELGEIEAKLGEHEGVLASIVIPSESRDRLIAYVVPAGQEAAPCEQSTVSGATISAPAERARFVLERRGVRKLDAGYARVDLEQTASAADPGSGKVSKQQLSRLLSVLKQEMFDDSPVPKYRYPSASSLYPVQLYLRVNAAVGDLLPGFYYYSSSENALVRLASMPVLPDRGGDDAELRAFWLADFAAIAPMYEHELARQMTLLEAGYMHAALVEEANHLGLALDTTWHGWIEGPFSDEMPEASILLGSARIDVRPPAPRGEQWTVLQRQSFRTFSAAPLSGSQLSSLLRLLPVRDEYRYLLYLRSGIDESIAGGAWYEYHRSTDRVRLLTSADESTVAAMYNAQNARTFLASALSLLITCREQESQQAADARRIEVGQIGQRLMSRCWRFGVGVCPIGHIETHGATISGDVDVVHSFLGGAIEPQQLESWQPENMPAGALLTERALKTFLRQRLPAYMVPSAYVFLEALPLTATGKVDRRGLPQPDGIQVNEDTYEAPQTPVETAIAKVWMEHLEVPRIGRTDNFFSLGGNSLLAMKVVARLRAEHGLDVNLLQMFENPTVEEFARLASRTGVAQHEDELNIFSVRQAYLSRQTGTDLRFPVSRGQQQLCAHEQMAGARSTYNIMLTMEFRDAPDAHILGAVFRSLLERHEVLNARISVEDGRFWQRFVPQDRLDVPVASVPGSSRDEVRKNLQHLLNVEAEQPFQILGGALIRFRIFGLRDDELVATLTVHHVIADYLSVEVLQRDLASIYRNHRLGAVVESRPRKLHFADFVLWQEHFLETQRAQEQIDYWRQRLGNVPRMEFRRGHGGATGQFCKTHAYSLDPAAVAALKAGSRRSDVTTFMYGMAALHQVMAVQCNQSDIIIGTPISTRAVQELEDVVGLMLNTLAVRIDAGPECSGEQLLTTVRERCLGAIRNREVPHEVVLKSLPGPQPLYAGNLYRARFVYRNTGAGGEHGDIEFKQTRLGQSDAKFDLLVTLNDIDGTLYGEFEYRDSLLDEQTAAIMAEQFVRALGWLTEHPGEPLAKLSAALHDLERQRDRQVRELARQKRQQQLDAFIR
ncbi:amino acid adenylation domain-containing protein [Steroidobacter sp. S1-65]|uniref:Amino acid adenylation domain-containing protein n=1 Tax=Steroidobacter gossypii TaxID=2805490 RepID=A0ABS1WZX0_9GAMM|nr:non-ribosomal peptide synthetase [Steroidobacter gossypii]MBM0106531.1 amino acid adenylation domain-containing protein [Steroidobacter gossypii]